MPVRALFWDSDNTIVDTGEMHWRKHKFTLAAHCILLPDHERERIYTNNGQQNWEWLAREYGLSLACADYLALIDQWYANHIGDIHMREGVSDVMQLAEQAGIPQAIVSNGRKNSVLLSLQPHRVVDRVRFVLCKEDYEGRKPDPAPYLAALNRMNRETGLSLQPSDCLAIEDDPKGVQSAARAGMFVIHRKLSAEQPDSPYATAAVFDASAFVGTFQKIIA